MPYDDRWLLLEHLSGGMPDIRQSALVAEAIRAALVAGYARAGIGLVPVVVSGARREASEPSVRPLAIIPMAFVGSPHANGHVTGFALLAPRGSGILDDADFSRALEAVAAVDARIGRRLLAVESAPGRADETAFAIRFSPTFDPPRGKRALDPLLYTRPTRTFASVTPIVLDMPVTAGEASRDLLAEKIAAACRDAGLPAPEVVIPDEQSALEGAPAARTLLPPGDPSAWSLPPALAGHYLTHAVIQFATPVPGPMLLCAGEAYGLGLCRPLFVTKGAW